MMLSDMNILVAGASGTNGRELVKRLTFERIPVRAFVRDKRKSEYLLHENVELVEGDLSDVGSLERSLENIETAYIVTGIHAEAVTYFTNFFNAAKRVGVKHVIKLSGLGADLSSPSEILRQHGESDLRLMESSLTYTILRPNSFFQNLFWQAAQIRRKSTFSLPLADAKQSLVDVRDIAEATVNILRSEEAKDKIYNLTGPECLSFHAVAAQLSDILGRRIKYIPITANVSEQMMRLAGVPGWNARALAEVQNTFASRRFGDVYDDLHMLLDREPRKFSDFARWSCNAGKFGCS